VLGSIHACLQEARGRAVYFCCLHSEDEIEVHKVICVYSSCVNESMCVCV
jgi:hypothetical protein